MQLVGGDGKHKGEEREIIWSRAGMLWREQQEKVAAMAMRYRQRHAAAVYPTFHNNIHPPSTLGPCPPPRSSTLETSLTCTNNSEQPKEASHLGTIRRLAFKSELFFLPRVFLGFQKIFNKFF